MGAAQMFKRLYWIWGIFANISACDKRGRSNFKWYHQNWLYYWENSSPWLSAQFNLLQKNCLIFSKIFARDNRGRSDFQVASTKMLFFLRKRYLLKKISSSNFQVTSLNLGHFFKNFSSQYRGRSYFKVNA